MTTIIYKDGILAADTQRTLASTRKAQHRCLECNKPVDLIQDAAKIKIGFNTKFNNEKILAVGTAGSVGSSGKAVELLQQGEDIIAIYTAVKKLGGAHSPPHFGLLIVTDRHIWNFSNRPEAVVVTKYKKDEVVGIGSGSDIAIFSSRVLETSAVDSVYAAMLEDKHTGGSVTYVDCTKTKLKIDTSPEIEQAVFLERLKKKVKHT